MQKTLNLRVMGSEIDLLAVGICMLRKSKQDSALKIDYKDEFEPG